MIRLRFFLAALFCLAAPLAHAAGFQLIEVPADGSRPALKGGIWPMRSSCSESVLSLYPAVIWLCLLNRLSADSDQNSARHRAVAQRG